MHVLLRLRGLARHLKCSAVFPVQYLPLIRAPISQVGVQYIRLVAALQLLVIQGRYPIGL